MPEDCKEASMPDTWSPRMDSYEWYSRWAIHGMAPCEDCSTEYREAYARLQGAVESADQCFRFAYGLYAELDSVARRELPHDRKTSAESGGVSVE